MFINLTNHPSTKWTPEQLQAAEDLGGQIIDVPFPNVDPEGDEEYLNSLVAKYFQRCEDIVVASIPNPRFRKNFVHLMGETGFCARLGARLNEIHAGPWPNFTVIHSTTERKVVENPETGEKTSVFKFVRFRRTYDKREG